jgi:hypothetical protein
MQFIQTVKSEEPVPVGVVQQPVIASTSMKGYDLLLFVIENVSLTETFSGVASTSPNGQTQWTNELSDEFGAIAPGETRRMILTSDRLNARVLGNFAANPASVHVTVVRLGGAAHRG